MKNILKVVFLLCLLAGVIIYNEQITNFIVERYIIPKEIHLKEANNYALDYDFEYINTNRLFFAYEKKDIINIIYTALNYGYDSFYFICKYEQCEDDISNLTKTDEFADINNFVHPFNTYNNLYISINSLRKVNVIVHKSYNNDEINIVNQKLDEIINNIIDSNMSDKEKIKAFHDYIVNNTEYDSEYVNNNFNDIDNPSHSAIGTLIYKKALCGGYSETMSIFLNKLKIPNYRIASESHVWNLVYLNNKWYHLDSTWDDPSDRLIDTFFLIDTKTLEDLKTGYHTFNKNIYLEAN